METAKAPLIELHRHLLGSISEEMVACQLRKYNDLTQVLTSAQKDFFLLSTEGRAFYQTLKRRDSLLTPADFQRFSTLPEFLQSYLAASTLILDVQDFSALVKGVVEDLTREGITYAEITVSPSLYMDKGIPLESLLAVLTEYKTETPTTVRWLLDTIRNRGADAAITLLEGIQDIAPQLFSGVSLAGDEKSMPLEEFSRYFTLAKDSGLGVTAHVGETFESKELPLALTLPIDRIGHGIAAARDPHLMEAIAKKEIPLEICLTSNVKTGMCKSYESHPIGTLIDQGVKVTINTDDPFFFQTSLPEELSRALALLSVPIQWGALSEQAQEAAFNDM